MAGLQGSLGNGDYKWGPGQKLLWLLQTSGLPKAAILPGLLSSSEARKKNKVHLDSSALPRIGRKAVCWVVFACKRDLM